MIRMPVSLASTRVRAAQADHAPPRRGAGMNPSLFPLPAHRFADLMIDASDAAPIQMSRKSRRHGRWRKPREVQPRPAPAQDPNDRTLSFRDLPPGPVRAYRMEASTQQYDNSGRPKWAHVHVGSHVGNTNTSHLYLPKPTANYSRPEASYTPDDPRRRYKSKTKGLPRDDQAYAQEFLKNQRDTGRNSMFVNFGEPKRALE